MANRSSFMSPEMTTTRYHPIPVETRTTGTTRARAGGEQKVYVSGVPVRIIAERVEYIGTDGQLITESYREFAKKQIEAEFASLDDFVRRWNAADRKRVIIDELEQHGVILENLAAEVGKGFDPFDLIVHVAYDQRPLTRRERAEKVRKRNYFAK
jgi:type I restriction enzyme R subunit